MLIEETRIEKADGEYIQIEFKHHKATVYVADIPATFDRCPALRLAKAKTEVIERFLNSSEGKHFTEKEVLKAYSKIDKHFADIYKEKYPHGGWRQGGRPKGSKTSNRTERLQQSLTPEEKEFLCVCLEWYRSTKNENPELLEQIIFQLKNYKQIIGGLPVGMTGQLREIKTPNKNVSDEYIQAVKEVQQEQPRRKLRTLDEAYKEYQERHKDK